MYLLDQIKSASSAVRGIVDMALGNILVDPVITPIDLRGKRALVTGSNTGIGLEIARSLASQGAETYLLCRSFEKAEKARDDIRTTTGNQEVYVEVVDFESLESVRAFIKRWEKRGAEGQTIDILVLNAGALPSSTVNSGILNAFPYLRRDLLQSQTHHLRLRDHLRGQLLNELSPRNFPPQQRLLRSRRSHHLHICSSGV